MSDNENEDRGEWQWENAGFGMPRAKLALPMEVGQTFEEYMEGLEAEQKERDAKDNEETARRRALMEKVAVQVAQYKLLQSKNARFLKAAKDYKYYEIPRLYLVRPVMTEKAMVDFLNKNQELLQIVTDLVSKNEAIAKLDAMELVQYAE